MYTNGQDAEHLINALKILYSIKNWYSPWSGTTQIERLICIFLTTSQRNFISSSIRRQTIHKTSLTAKPDHDQANQYVNPEDAYPLLSLKKTSLVQKIIGAFLYFSPPVNPAMLVFPGDLVSTQAKATLKNHEDLVCLIHYSTSHLMAIIIYKASDMTLQINADALYLSVSRDRICDGEHHHISENS